MSKKILVIVLVAFITMIASVSVAHANHEKLDICCAWDDSLADGDLTYTVSGSSDEAQATVADTVEAWEDEVPELTLSPLVGGGKPDIKIRLNSGGGPIAGTAKRRFDGPFVKSVDLSISGKFLGEEVSQLILGEVARHEMGHALGVSHANFDDLMDPTVGGETAISACDVDGVLAANAWWFDNPDPNDPGTPAAPAVSEVDCSSGAALADDVGLTAITGPGTAAQGDFVVISFTVFNHGNNSAIFDLTATEVPGGGSESLLGVTLSSGESGDFALAWLTNAETSLGEHTWTFTHNLSGDLDSSNDSVSHTVTITEPSEEEADCPPRSMSPQCR